MIKLLQWLLMGHVHKWEDVTSVTLVNDSGATTGMTTHSRCIHCGEHTSFTNWN